MIAKASGNDELAEMLGHLLERLASFMVIRKADDSLTDIHGLLLSKLRARDFAGAKNAVRSELNDTKVAIMDRIINEEGEYMLLGDNNDKVK